MEIPLQVSLAEKTPARLVVSVKNRSKPVVELSEYTRTKPVDLRIGSDVGGRFFLSMMP